ncbi:MAG TPA: magnesium transporter CorA family protein [Anaeromyxobacteraceae bacterium]|nr:magnesium transporter CorA family protein [Anaeromyxobacteraceae bacterium]
MRVLRLEGGRVLTGGRELAGPGAPIWIDLAPAEDDIAFLGARFGFHPLALEDCVHEGQRVKFEQYPDHLFTVVHRLYPAPDESGIQSSELHAFLTGEALVTVHQPPIAQLDEVFARCERDPALLARGPDFALYLIHDAITDVHFAVVDALTQEVEELTEEALGTMDLQSDLLERIVEARRAHALLRRRLAPQREVYASLARPGQAVVRDGTALYFRDVTDHVVRLTEEIDGGRDLVSSAMEVHLSRANVRLASVTTRLTLVATVFLPLNFLAGFFGMNLEILPPPVAIPLVLGAMVLLPTGLLWFLRRRRLT